MRRVIILTASFGQGHNAAASGLREAFQRVAPEVQVQVLDPLKLCYGMRNELARRMHLAMVRHAPRIWAWLYRTSDRTAGVGGKMRWFKKLRRTLHDLLAAAEPDVVISTYPAYNCIIDQIYADHRERPFRTVMVVTDSLSIHSAWHASPSDSYFVPNQPTADVLTRAGVPSKKVLAYGFPVSPRFHELAEWQFMPTPGDDDWTRVLYVIHHGKAKAGRVIERLLEIPGVQLTVACGGNRRLRERITRRTRHAQDRVHVFGWTERMPELLASSHLIITKAGGAMVQEALAAHCPIIVNQAIPGQEEGNAQLVEMLGVGVVAGCDNNVISAVHRALADNAQVWRTWKAALDRHSQPDAALRIVRNILEQCDASQTPDDSATSATVFQPRGETPPAVLEPERPLLCDFHAHTTFSDGELSPAELVDFYGARGFDCLCITDHATEKRHVIGKLMGFTGLVMTTEKMAAYFDVIEREKRRAWAKYNMVLMTGLELNKDRLTADASAHLLALDLQAPVDPNLDLKSLVRAIQRQGSLAVAAHPHNMQHRLGDRNTRFLWNHRKEFAPLLDAWEVASRLDVFNPIARQQLPFLANSDFHKPQHIVSWKTLLRCEKHPHAIKQCIRESRNVAITFHREKAFQPAHHLWPFAPAMQPGFLGAYSPAQLLLPLAA